MPSEVEAKIILGDCSLLDRLEEKLRSLGAQLIEEKREEDTYYQHPCRDFAETDEALRIRHHTGRPPELTYKGPKRLIVGGGVAKSRYEETVTVGDAEAMHRILEFLGFRPVATVAKTRKYYRLGDVLITLDRVEGLGCFLEAEYQGTGGLGKAVKAIEQALRTLGIQDEPRTMLSYLELLLAQKREKQQR